MGYTHYWRRSDDFADKTWLHLRSIAIDLMINCEPEIAGWNGTELPLIDDEVISFNGLDDEAGKNFTLYRGLRDGFSFCSTARKPYDVVVTALLIAAQNLQPMAILVTSDGEAQDWVAGLELLNQASPNPNGPWSIPVTVADPDGDLA